MGTSNGPADSWYWLRSGPTSELGSGKILYLNGLQVVDSVEGGLVSNKGEHSFYSNFET